MRDSLNTQKARFVEVERALAAGGESVAVSRLDFYAARASRNAYGRGI